MVTRPEVRELEKKARDLRADILTMLTEAGSGHTGSSLSCVELILTLYAYKLRIDPRNPAADDRDRFVLSKGHAGPSLYAILADFGFIPKEKLGTLRKLGSSLQGHPQFGLNGLEASTGSLGQGLSIANGMALASKLDCKDTRVYCLMGDGETNEGQVWEAAMTSAHYKLDNLCAMIDFNKLQIDGFLCDVMSLEPVIEKWQAFGWHVIEIDGHNFHHIMDALDEAETIKEKPVMILAHTVKGKGVSFMENKARWHGIAPTPEELKRALKELDV
ncbi:MAG: transketolase [Candidatus Omnitrophota bacterium]